MTVKTYLRNKYHPNNKFRLNGLVPSQKLPQKRQLCQSFRSHVIYRADQLPPKVDLRADMTPVEDQSKIGSCAANCLAGAYEYISKKANGRDTDVSRLFIYYNARVKDQRSQNVKDTGCTMTSAIEALEEFGTCLESVWPYDISRVNIRPENQAYDEAKRHKITEALQLDINLYEMKSCLAQGFPFAFGLRLYSTFDQAAKTGVVPMPNAWDNNRQSHGSHAMLAVGYSDQSQAFIVRNSWGEQWGDKGYCYIPYNYIANTNYCFDVWTVRKLAMDDFGREHWDIKDIVNLMRIKNHALLPDNNYSNDGNDDSIIESYDEDDDSNNDSSNSDRQRERNDYPWRQYPDYGNFYNQNNWQRNRFEGYPPGPNNFYYNRFSNENDFYNPFMNNPPNYFNNRIPSPSPPPLPPLPPRTPPAYPRQPYGLSYGYSSPMDNFFGPFF